MTSVPPNPSISPTHWQTLVASGLVGAGIGWLLFAIPDQFGLPLPQIPFVSAIGIGVLALVIAVAAWIFHRKVQVRREAVDARRGLTLVVLAKACMLSGVGLTGAYVAVVVTFVPRIWAELPRERVVVSAVAAVASIGLAISGAFLERACRIPSSSDQDAPKNLPNSNRPSH